MVTDIPARVLGLDRYGVAPGRVADLVLVPANSVAEAVLDHPRRRTVLKRGRLVARDGMLAAKSDRFTHEERR